MATHPNVIRILNEYQIEQKSEEWYNRRSKLLTASDCGTVLGINPYKTRKKLLQEKLGKSKKLFKGNFITEHGHKFEPIAIEKYSVACNDKVYDTGLYIHPAYKWLGASPDGITASGKLVEVKCPFKREIKHEVPCYYYPQIQVQLEVCDIDECVFIQYKPKTNDQEEVLDILTVPRDKMWFENNFKLLEDFWNEWQDSQVSLTDKSIDCSNLFPTHTQNDCMF